MLDMLGVEELPWSNNFRTEYRDDGFAVGSERNVTFSTGYNSLAS